ncbi:beta-ketoacyl-[acyl-carrier-protein] synthase family protein [Pollutibacter soli]|uniref:beta-ketoacyl-[acyl-carrier-protein] synthase family protein n=1 Tax=Pollutibacter soli TaxID=3034157 RepID=UPI003013624C
MSRILVTGMGVVSAIGSNVAENRQSLINGICGITRLEGFQSRFAGLMPFGEIKKNNSGLAAKYNLTKPGITRPCLLGLMAMKEMLDDAGLDEKILRSRSTAFINATTVGGMCLTDELYHDANAADTGSPYLGAYDNADTTLFLREYFGIGGVVNSINTACSSSANAIAFGAALIKTGRADRVIAGGVDCLAKFTINGFNSLHILSNELCRPFDESRKGLNLGEAAAYVVLESEDVAQNKKSYATLTGYCNANDAFHPSSLSDTGVGPYNAMHGALQKASLSPGDIGYINAHGTGTENNDLVESVAMQRLFENQPAFSSTKGNTGHTLGAAGSLESIFSILCLTNQEIYPALQFENKIPETGLIPNREYRKYVIEHVMTNSFGFGGNCTSLIFSRS